MSKTFQTKITFKDESGKVFKKCFDVTEDALRETGLDMARLARAKAPRGEGGPDGHYAPKIEFKAWRRMGLNAALGTGQRIGFGVFAPSPGAHLEYGTSKMSARPHLWPAYEEATKKLASRIENKV